jgi:hypothetical protein
MFHPPEDKNAHATVHDLADDSAAFRRQQPGTEISCLPLVNPTSDGNR